MLLAYAAAAANVLHSPDQASLHNDHPYLDSTSFSGQRFHTSHQPPKPVLDGQGGTNYQLTSARGGEQAPFMSWPLPVHCGAE